MLEIGHKEVLGAITVIMVFWGYGKYILDTWKGETTPHIFSWIVFFLLGIVNFFIQSGDGAGPGAWSTVAAFITAFVIILLSLKQGSKNITFSDTLSLILALVSIVLYVSIEDASYALFLSLFITIMAFYPTFRKTYYKPTQETLITYILAGIRSFLSIIATLHYSFLTIGNPALLVLINICFVGMVLIRKKNLGLK